MTIKSLLSLFIIIIALYCIVDNFSADFSGRLSSAMRFSENDRVHPDSIRKMAAQNGRIRRDSCLDSEGHLGVLGWEKAVAIGPWGYMKIFSYQ